MMICIGIKYGSSDFVKYTVAYSIMPMLFMWLLFAIIRFPKWHGLIKAAVCVLVSAIIFFFNDTVVLLIFNSELYIPAPAFNFDTYENINGTLCWSVLIAGVVLSAIFGTVGLIKSKSNNKKEISK